MSKLAYKKDLNRSLKSLRDELFLIDAALTALRRYQDLIGEDKKSPLKFQPFTVRPSSERSIQQRSIEQR